MPTFATTKYVKTHFCGKNKLKERYKHNLLLTLKNIIIMMKTLRFFMMSALMLVAGAMYAQNATITFDPTTDKGTCDSSNPGADQVTKDGVTIAVSNGCMNLQDQYRCYKSQTFTVTSTVGNITKVQIQCTASGEEKYGPGCFSAPSVGTYAFEGNVGTWTGDAAEFTLSSATNQVRMSKVIVTIGEGGGETPEPQPTDAQTVTIAEFNAAAESTDVWYQLTGTVSNLKDGDLYGNFDLTDETGTVYVYGLLAEKGGAKKKFQELVAEKGIVEGCKLTLIGNRGSYNDKIEVLNAYFVAIEGGQITPGPQPSDVEEIDVATALLNISACKPGVDFPGTFRVKGYVVSEPDFQRNNEQVLYGNVNFMMADASDEIDASRKLTVFRAKNFGNVAFTEETIGTLKQGDLVVVEGTLTNYAKDNIETPEIKNCFLVSINGDTGINNVKAGNGQNGRMHNLAGQVVNNGYKGLVIMNGRKYVNR